VALEGKDPFSFESIPDVAIEVVVTGKKETPTNRESNGGDPAENIVVGVLHELPVRSYIEEPARGVVRTSTESHAVGEELNSIDVGLVALERLDALPVSKIPQFRGSITSARDKGVLIRRIDRDAHNVAVVVAKLGNFGARLYIPENASHIPGAGDDLPVVQEAAAREVTSMRLQLSANADGNVSAPQIVDGADIIETTASNEASGGGISAGHHPR